MTEEQLRYMTSMMHTIKCRMLEIKTDEGKILFKSSDPINESIPRRKSLYLFHGDIHKYINAPEINLRILKYA
jgi:hypothetical protein